MLGGSFFRDFEEDPFFAAQHRQHQHMQPMLMLQPGLAPPMSPMLHPQPEPSQQPRRQRDPNHRHRHHHHRHHHRPRQDVVPFGMFGQDFGFGAMFSNMRRMMDDMHRSFNTIQMSPSPTANSHTFSQSTFVSYSNSGQGQPQVYQASSSTRHAPGGVKETRRTVRDTSSGVEKMAIGHHINERAHLIERSRNRKTGEQNENTEFVNIDEDEAPTFDREWQEKTRHHGHQSRGMDIHRVRHNPIGSARNVRHIPALPEPRPRVHSSRSHRE